MILWILILRVPDASASFCGRSGVPFSVEVLPTGAPVLGCAQPTCLAQPADDIDDSIFNMDASGQIDGFFREGDDFHQGYLQTNKLRANCTEKFDQLACSSKNQWVGGIEYIDHPRQPISYEVAVRRMNCLPDPPEVEIAVDGNVESELVEVLENANNGSISLGHIEHPHIEHEKKQEKIWRREIKPRKRSRNDKRKYGQAQLMERPGSFGAPTFNPTNDSRQRPQSYSKFSRSEDELRPLAMESPPTTATTATPLFVFPTLPPYTFPTIPPPPQLFFFGQFSTTPPSRVLLSSSPASQFGLSRPLFTPALSTSLPEQSHRLQPQASSLIQLAQPHIHQLPKENYVTDNAAAHTHNNTAANHFQLHNSQAHFLTDTPTVTSPRIGMPIHAPVGTTQTQRKQEDLASLWQQQFFIFTPTPLMQLRKGQMCMSLRAQGPDIHESSTNNVAIIKLAEWYLAPSQKISRRTVTEVARGIYGPELVEPSLPPVHQHLEVLYHPPPFPALNSALQNFQAQG